MRFSTFFGLVILPLVACSPVEREAPTAKAPSLSTTSKFLKATHAVPGRYIVRFANTAGPGKSADVLARHSARALHELHSIHGVVVEMSLQRAQALAADPDVTYVEEEGIFTVNT